MISNRLYFPLHSFNVNLKDLLPGSPSLVGRKPGIVKKACDRKVSRVRIPLPAPILEVLDDLISYNQ